MSRGTIRCTAASRMPAGPWRTCSKCSWLRDIRATWATVGFLFAATRDEVDAFNPRERPTYPRAELDPYVEAIGIDEEHDPEHLAASLVELIRASAGQEVGSHTFSHYYCLEPGQNEAMFRADLAAAQAIALRRGVELTSLVLPRNQWNPAYAAAVLDLGFRCIRGPQRSWGHRARQRGHQSILHRGARLAETYVGVSPPPTTEWSNVLLPSGLCDVPASAFLRPYDPDRRHLEPLRLARLRSGMRHAARTWPDLPPVVAPAQFLAAPIRELRRARADPRRVRPAGWRRRHAVVDHGRRDGHGGTIGTGPDARPGVTFDSRDSPRGASELERRQELR